MSDDIYDYSQGTNSPQQHVQVGGGVLVAAIAVIFALLAFGAVIASCILIPDLIDSRSKSAAAQAYVTAGIAEREARISQDQIEAMRLELAKKGIHITTDRH